MVRFSITLNDELEEKFKDFQKRNNIKGKTKAIQECIRLITSSNDYVSTINEIESKLRTIIYWQNIQKKLLNQIYANHGFPENEDVKKDKYLKEFYEDNFDYKFGNIIN